MLDKAGAGGMQAGYISREFSYPEDAVRRQAWANSTLSQLARRGYVRRSARKEPSTFYHRVPVWRWRITAAGREYLASGGYSGARMAARAARDARQEARLNAAAELDRRIAAEVARMGDVSSLRGRARDEQILRLHETGMNNTEIGEMFGLCRERVRQIVAARRAAAPEQAGRVAS